MSLLEFVIFSTCVDVAVAVAAYDLRRRQYHHGSVGRCVAFATPHQLAVPTIDENRENFTCCWCFSLAFFFFGFPLSGFFRGLSQLYLF